uniref:Uncharacterized protein n=1 Tax=Chenopodium quinoa TaxID=63459 RepID=A0A803MBR7_CHEQI
MLVFVNILRLSSLSLTRRTSFNDDDNDNDNKDHQAFLRNRASSIAPKPNESSKVKKSHRSQKPEQPSELNRSYVMLPEHDETATVDEKVSDYIRRFHQKAQDDLQNSIVEGKAANYIKKFHEKNKKDLNNDSMRHPHYVLPPPPPQVFK